MANPKLPITRRALLARVNRAIAPKNRVVRVVRGANRKDFGEYIEVVNKGGGRGGGAFFTVDLVARARELGALKPYETLAGE